MEHKLQATRIQTSFLNAAEKKALVWLAERMPACVTSDMMTLVGVAGAFLTGLGFALTNYSIHFLWLATFGLAVNWFGDSLDGTIARVRRKQRPLYGYYLDHTVDVVNEAMMFMGAGLAPFFDIKVAMIAYMLYLALTLNVSINAHLKSEFRLTYAKLGPTEFRIIIAVANTVIWCFGDAVLSSPVPGWFVMGVTGILALIYLGSLIMDLRYYARIDPMPEEPGKD